MTELRERPRAITAAEGKRYAIAVIAIVYLIAWYELSTSPPPEAASAQVPPTVWIDQLPATERPAVTPPDGWRVASRDEQAAAPAVVRAPASRPIRVRTRSS